MEPGIWGLNILLFPVLSYISNIYRDADSLVKLETWALNWGYQAGHKCVSFSAPTPWGVSRDWGLSWGQMQGMGITGMLKPIIMVLFICLFYGTGHGTQGLGHAKQALSHSTSSAPIILLFLFGLCLFIFSCQCPGLC